MPFNTLRSMPLLLALAACSSSSDSLGSQAPPEAAMAVEISDLAAAVPVSGSFRFSQISGEDSISLQIVGGQMTSLQEFLTREAAGDLVAGRVVHGSPTGPGLPASGTYTVDGREVGREVRSLRMIVEANQTVTIIAELGPPLGESVSHLPPTATMTVRGQLRLTCSVPAEVPGGSERLDLEFASPYCSTLRTELGLDALLAISNSL